jgi:hypothetical protein
MRCVWIEASSGTAIRVMYDAPGTFVSCALCETLKVDAVAVVTAKILEVVETAASICSRMQI